MTYHPKTPVEGIVRIAVVLLVIGWAAAHVHAQEIRPTPPKAPESIVWIDGCTGVCVDPSGIILTAKHCKHDAVETVTFASGKSYHAKRLCESQWAEGAVAFQVETDTELPYSAVRKPEKFSLDQSVFAWGYPAGGSPSCYSGKLTGKHINLKDLRDENGQPFANGEAWLNESTIVNTPGCSGGPLLDENGQVCGLASLSDLAKSTYWVTNTDIYDVYTEAMKKRGQSPVTPQRTLIVYSADWCGFCKAVERDSSKISAQLQVIKSNHPAWVTNLPAFEYKGHRWFGYYGPIDLNARIDSLNKEPTPAVPEEHGVIGGGSSPAIGSCFPFPYRRGEPRAEQLPPDNDLTEILDQLSEVKQSIGVLQSSDSSIFSKIGELASLRGEIGKVKESVKPALTGIEELKQQYSAGRTEGNSPLTVILAMILGVLKRVGLNHKQDEPGVV